MNWNATVGQTEKGSLRRWFGPLRRLRWGLTLPWPLQGKLCGRASLEKGPGEAGGEYVVLLHGLGRTAISMKRIEWALRKDGYRVINISYPSRRLSIEEISRRYLPAHLEKRVREPGARVHFVTHSLGGIVVRQYLRDHRVPNLGRVVMLAPPNGGSDLVDRFRRNMVFRWLTGPVGQELGTEARSVPNRLGPAGYELGIIAGDRSWNPLFSAWIPGRDDGTVSVSRTVLAGMRDWLVVHRTHTWLMWSHEVVSATRQFLRTGRLA